MTIQQLRYFLALCQDLNYTRTAGPAVSVAAGAAAQHCRAGK